MPEPIDEWRALCELLPHSSIATQRAMAARLEQIRQRIERHQPVDRTLAECRARVEDSVAEVTRRRALPLNLTYPEQLPVSQRRADILRLLGTCRSFVLTGETGSGKTTQLPKMLLEAGYGPRGMIALTQPRRVAAVAMARRIREELQAGPGVVAHSVRFDDQATPDTLIRVMTDGLLLAEASADQDLARYDAIIVDEAHERSLNIDLLLALLKILRQRRPDLVVIVSSASIEAERFADFLGTFGVRRAACGVPQLDDARSDSGHSSSAGNDQGFSDQSSVSETPTPNAEHRTPNAVEKAPIISVSGRSFPVEIRHQPPADDDIGYLDATVSAVRNIHLELGTSRGDLLCFLPTERDILEARRRLDDLAGTSVLPLFGRLTPQEQQRVFQPSPLRKIVLATNVAETSLTIPGIRVVVDTGLARIKRYHAGSRTERLPVEAISQASLTQRAGRAGRVEAGVCIRLFSDDDAAKRDPFTTPEILRSNLAGVLLTCLHLGLGEPESLPWLDAPTPQAWRQARGLLDELGAFASESFGVRRSTFGVLTTEDARTDSRRLSSPKNDPEKNGQLPLSENPTPNAEPRTPNLARSALSPLGRQLAAIPADPQVARILIAGLHEQVPHEAATIAAFLSIQDPRVRPPGQESKADSAHRAFAHEAGDLATVLRLWDLWQAATSNSAKARFCESHFVGFRRMREWADVRHQLWRSLRDGARVQRGATPAAPLPPSGFAPDEWPLDRVHRAVLAGMLGNVLMYDRDERAYRGAGNRLLHVHPGSALRAGKADDGKKSPPPAPWLVACEVVETSRLFARLCAPIDPLWVIDLAGERVKRSHRDPHWHGKRRQVVCVETVTWKGLPLRDGKLVPYERIDPHAAFGIFIQQALCADDEVAKFFPIIARNRKILDEAKRLRHRLRDPSVFVDDSHVETFYRERLAFAQPAATATLVPYCLASTDALRRWITLHGAERLALSAADLVPAELVAKADREFPETLTMGGVRFPLDYRYAPGNTTDGATIELSEAHVAALDLQYLDRAIPGWLPEIIAFLLDQLPKDIRRQLIPLAESAKQLAEQLGTQRSSQPLAVQIADALNQRFTPPGARRPTTPVAATSFNLSVLPPYLRLRFRLRDAAGTLIYEGRDPAFIATQAAAAADRLMPLNQEWDTNPSGTWPGDCPGQVQHHGVTGFVALARGRDEHGLPAARRTVYASVASAAAWHDDGLDALLEASMASELERLATLPQPLLLAGRCERLLGQKLGAIRRSLALAVLRGSERKRVIDRASWDDLQRRAAMDLAAAARDFDPLLDRVTIRAETLRTRLKQGAKQLAAATVQRTAARHLDRLIGAGWLTRLPWNGLKRLDVYLDGIQRLLERVANQPADAQRAATRRDGLIDLWDSTIDDGHRRLIGAIGLAPAVRELAMRLEESLVSADGGKIGTAAGFAEAQLRDGINTMSEQLAAAADRLAAGRQRLIEIHAVTARLVPGKQRDRLHQECLRMTRDFPDLGLGCDVDAQLIAIQALEDRIRTALATVR